MIISAKIIRKPRKSRYCEICSDHKIDGPQLRLFGAASQGDKPYVIYVHPKCASNDPKIIAAKQAAK